MELADKALKSNPDNYNFLHTKGWGLYKQGKYQRGIGDSSKKLGFKNEKCYL